MNRNRKIQIPKMKQKPKRHFSDSPFRSQAAVMKNPFEDTPTATLCQSIMLLIEELRSRGCPLRDFDNKERTLQQIQILGNNIFFMAAPEQEEEQDETSQETHGV